MDRFDFFKTQYLKEEDKKNEINNSFSLPIGIITIITGALFFLLTNFDFKTNLIQSIFFAILSTSSFVFLCISVFFLIKAYTNFHNGYGYNYLADTNDLESYYQAEKKYYKTNTQLLDISDKEFEEYIFGEIVKNTDINQKNNKKKSYYRYICLKHLITAFIILFFTVFPFSINYMTRQKLEQNIILKTENPIDVNINNDQVNNTNKSHLKHHAMCNESNDPKPEKPTPPPSQTIKEGQDPSIRPIIITPIPQTDKPNWGNNDKK